ncbi:hypothetical protein, partial [Moorella sp. E308F]|uniref:hypothetical protein n=1 Tax=Moorella sp. E308F TaxID=2572682 RepID=UPI001143DEE9
MRKIDPICAKGAENIDLKPYMSIKQSITGDYYIVFKNRIPMWRTVDKTLDGYTFFIAGGGGGGFFEKK